MFIQDTTTDTMLQTLDKYHQFLKTENLKAAPDESIFFLESVKFLGYQIQSNHIHSFQIKIDSFLKLQLTKNKKINSILCWISSIYLKIYLQSTSNLETLLSTT